MQEAASIAPVFVPVGDLDIGPVRRDGKVDLMAAPEIGEPVSHFTTVDADVLARFVARGIARLAEMGVTLKLREMA